MMVKLLLYGYCTGRMSSRKLERACYDDVAMRVLTGDQQPDHASIAEFRRRHLAALEELFVQVLLVCEKAGLVKLGRVAIDGTKLKANAAKRHTHSYQRLVKREAEVLAKVKEMMRQAAQTDAAEDRKYGAGRGEEDLPEQLRTHEAQLAAIQAAKTDLEREAKAAEAAASEQKAKEKADRAAGKEVITRKRKKLWKQNAAGEIEPLPKRTRNLTDLDSRLMKDSSTETFVQGYNAQAAVDEEGQIIVACQVTPAGNDMDQLVPTLLLVKKNLGKLPEQVLADSGYFSPAGLADQRIEETDLYVKPNYQPKPKVLELPGVPPELLKPLPSKRSNPANARIRAAMTEKLAQVEAKAIYQLRSKIVEPVFGQIKHARGIRQFLLRGEEKVKGEWALICLSNNLLKLFQLRPDFKLR
jgi:hypothetical protein